MIMDDNQQYEVATKLTDETLRKLEASGLRMTTQRRHIIEILTSSQCTSPKELWFEAKQFVPDLGIATVYRLINRLEQIGVISKARNLGMQNVCPKIGTITDRNGKKVPNSYYVGKLESLIKEGLISQGIISKNQNIVLNLVGDKINVTVV